MLLKNHFKKNLPYGAGLTYYSRLFFTTWKFNLP